MRKNTEILAALRQAVYESGEYSRLARAIKHEFGWQISDHDAENRLSQWLSPSNRNRFPVDALPILMRFCMDTITPILLRAAIEARERKGPMRRDNVREESRRRA